MFLLRAPVQRRRQDAASGYRNGMTTTPYDPGDDPVAPDPLVPEELDDREPDVADDEES